MTAPSPIPAETYAARRIAGDLDGGRRPDLAAIADDSGLTIREVEDVARKLVAKRRKAMDPPAPLQAVPDPEPAPVVALVSEPEPVPESAPAPQAFALPAAWLEHRSERVRKLAHAAYKALEAVEAAVAEDASKDALYARRHELQAEMDDLNEKLGMRGNEVLCPDCNMAVHPQGMGPHRAAKHKAGA